MLNNQIVKSFNGEPPMYCYFHGCFHGWRQDLTLAQQYSDAYDGISTNATAIEMPVDSWVEPFRHTSRRGPVRLPGRSQQCAWGALLSTTKATSLPPSRRRPFLTPSCGASTAFPPWTRASCISPPLNHLRERGLGVMKLLWTWSNSTRRVSGRWPVNPRGWLR